MSQYVILKLVSETIFGSIDDDGNSRESTLTVRDPLVMEEMLDEYGNTHTALVRYCPQAADYDVPIIKTSIVSISIMSPVFKDFYEGAIQLARMSDDSYNKNLIEITHRMQAMRYSNLSDSNTTIH